MWVRRVDDVELLTLGAGSRVVRCCSGDAGRMVVGPLAVVGSGSGPGGWRAGGGAWWEATPGGGSSGGMRGGGEAAEEVGMV